MGFLMDKVCLAVFSCLLWCQVVLAQNMASDHYGIKARVISAGGSAIVSQHYESISTTGQPTPVEANDFLPASDSYTLKPGFWYQVRPEECECTLSKFAQSFGETTAVPSNCCDIDWEGDVDGDDLFLLLPGL